MSLSQKDVAELRAILARAISEAWHRGRFTALDLRDGIPVANAIIEAGGVSLASQSLEREDEIRREERERCAKVAASGAWTKYATEGVSVVGAVVLAIRTLSQQPDKEG